MGVQLKNNCVGQLLSNINSIVTTITLVFGDGAKFPALAAGDWHPATILKIDGTLEIVRVTARTGDTFTVLRGREGTTPMAFSAGDRFELRFTAGSLIEVFSSYATTTQLSALQTQVTALSATVAGKQDDLGFTPVRQGGGANMDQSVVRIGWSPTENLLRLQVNSAQFGFLIASALPTTFTALQTFSNGLTASIITCNGTALVKGGQFTLNADATGATQSIINIQASGKSRSFWYNALTDNFIFSNIGGGDVVTISNTGVITTGAAITAADFIIASDGRLKEKWRDLSKDWLERLAETKAGSYKLIGAKGRYVGVEAQSLSAAMPDAVRRRGDGMLTVSHGASLAAMVMLARETVKLKERIAALEAE